jgi:hypothetical protein
VGMVPAVKASMDQVSMMNGNEDTLLTPFQDCSAVLILGPIPMAHRYVDLKGLFKRNGAIIMVRYLT